MSTQIPAPDDKQIAPILHLLVDRVVEVAQHDDRLRELLGQVGRSLIGLANGGAHRVVDLGQSKVECSGLPEAVAAPLRNTRFASEVGTESPQGPETQPHEPLPPLTLGMSVSPSEAAQLTSHAATGAPESLVDVAKRCRLKAEACRWAVTRNRRLSEGADYEVYIRPLDADIISRAKLLSDCFLWMCHPATPVPEDPSEFEVAADCFDICADAAELLDALAERGDAPEGYLARALDLAAEAQSMLRVCLAGFWDRTDSDQKKLFDWLRQCGQREQILVGRHMRLDDPANPADIQSLRERLQELDQEVTLDRERDKQRRQHFNKLRYHLKLIRNAGESPSDRDWQKVALAIERLVEEGLPASNIELRDMLVPFVDLMPESVAQWNAVQRVLAEIDRYLATRPPAVEAAPRERATPAVERVRRLLSGRTILLIGGEVRANHKAALEDAFGLREVVWMKTREHNPRIDFEPDVSRPDVAVVILAIRWSRHSYGDVEPVCRKHGKLLVRLPAGYNPNQVAEQILAQCSDRLEKLEPVAWSG